MSESKKPKPASNVLLVRTEGQWWDLDDTGLVWDLPVSTKARRVLLDANVCRVAEVRDPDRRQDVLGVGGAVGAVGLRDAGIG